MATAMGFCMRLLDLGGGFCAGFDAVGNIHLGGVPQAVNAALDAFFPADSDVKVIAEPGRYFAEAPSTLACCVYGNRLRYDEVNPHGQLMTGITSRSLQPFSQSLHLMLAS